MLAEERMTTPRTEVTLDAGKEALGKWRALKRATIGLGLGARLNATNETAITKYAKPMVRLITR